MSYKSIVKNLFDWFEANSNLIFFSVLIFYLLAGFAYSYYLGDCLKFPDERAYISIAKNLATGHGYSYDGVNPTAFFPPLYPIFLSFFIKLGFPIFLLRFINYIILVLSLLLIRSILNFLKAEKGVGVSSFLMFFYVVLFYTAGTFYPQTLYTLILLALIRIVLIGLYRRIYAISFGVLSASIVLTHGTGIFIPPLLILWLLLRSEHRAKTIKCLIGSVLIAIVCISIWGYRNYKVFHKFIPLTTHGGDTLYIGNNPNTHLSAWYTYVNDEFYKKVSKLPEPEQNKYYIKKTLDFWFNQPVSALKLYLLKLIDYFNFRNNLYVQSEFNTLRSLVMFFTYYPLLFCLMIRLCFIFKYPPTKEEWLFISIYIVSAFFHAIFLPRIRFRLPYDVVLIAYIGYLFGNVRFRFQTI